MIAQQLIFNISLLMVKWVHLRSTLNDFYLTMMTFLFKQIWYEVTCDIPEDTELLLGPKVPLLISDMRREADDRSGSGL